MLSNRKIKDAIQSLNDITKSTNSRVYGLSKDLPGILTRDVNSYIERINLNKDKNKALINSHMSRDYMDRNKNINLYDFVNTPDIVSSIESTVGMENMQFANLLKDYEMIKRCLPQVHRVINTLRNNIVSPDSMGTDTILGINIPSGTDPITEKRIRDIVEKYELNQKIQTDIVIDYLIASVKYATIVPYTMIPEMLHNDPEFDIEKKINLTEVTEYLDNLTRNDIKPLSEAAGKIDYNEAMTLHESIMSDDKPYYENDLYIGKPNLDIQDIVNTQLENIEFVNGGLAYYKTAILNEAIDIMTAEDKELKSMKKIVSDAKKHMAKVKMNEGDSAAEGLIDDKTYEDIKKNVNFKGAHIEFLPAAQTIAFRLRGTIIGYFYVEDRIDPNKNSHTLNASSIMDKINASVYLTNTKINRGQEVQNAIVRAISERLIKAVNPKFLNDNYEDMDIIYEFVKANELHIKGKRVIFFHPNDICEFKRSEGSIMKNCMFYAKLMILTLLTNIITKVTRGADRNLHYVKTGLSTDIEGSVNDTIRAIKQNQIRYSDIGTINEIFNIVGSNVDVFMPQSIDGEKPIETETISGQNVDMNDEFLNFITRSIIQSFGVPASIIDDMDSVEFAKTISMSNLDMAKAVYDAQVELNPVFTKMYRALVHYELPDYEQWNDIEVRLNPPTVILYEMNRDKISAIEEVAEKLTELLIPMGDEQPEDKKKRLFKLEYFRRNMTSWDWSVIDDILAEVLTKAEAEKIEATINSDDQNFDDGSGGGYGGGGDMGY